MSSFVAADDSLIILTRTDSVNTPSVQSIIRKPFDGGDATTLRKCLGPVECSTIGATGGKVFFFERPNDSSRWSLYAGTSTETFTKVGDDFLAPPTPNVFGVAAPTLLIELNGAIFFRALVNTEQLARLWRSDGTVTGTALVQPDLLPVLLKRAGDRLFFVGSDATTTLQPWESDGTATGTRPLAIINAKGSNPQRFTTVGTTLFFVAKDATPTESSLWRSDGTPTGTIQLTTPGSGETFQPRDLLAAGDQLFFRAGNFGAVRLWRSDGTVAGTLPVPCPENDCLQPRTLFAFGNRVVYTAGFGPEQLWISDGSNLGIKIWDADQESGTRINQAAEINGVLYLLGNNVLLRSDGTAAGTTIITTLGPAFGTNAGGLEVVGTRLFFSNNDATNGGELWTSDLTAAGTRIVQDFSPGSASTSFAAMEAFNGALYVQIYNGNNFRRLYRTDGSPDSITLVADISATNPQESINCLISGGSKLFFTSGFGVSTNDLLWVTDGTSPGTRRVPTSALFVNMNGSPFDCRAIANGNNGIIFSGYTPAGGVEPWQSDGTVGGTRQITDIAPGATSSSPLYFAKIGARFLTSADDQATGFELWAFDTTWSVFAPIVIR